MFCSSPHCVLDGLHGAGLENLSAGLSWMIITLFRERLMPGRFPRRRLLADDDFASRGARRWPVLLDSLWPTARQLLQKRRDVPCEQTVLVDVRNRLDDLYFVSTFAIWSPLTLEHPRRITPELARYSRDKAPTENKSAEQPGNNRLASRFTPSRGGGLAMFPVRLALRFLRTSLHLQRDSYLKRSYETEKLRRCLSSLRPLRSRIRTAKPS